MSLKFYPMREWNAILAERGLGPATDAFTSRGSIHATTLLVASAMTGDKTAIKTLVHEHHHLKGIIGPHPHDRVKGGLDWRDGVGGPERRALFQDFREALRYRFDERSFHARLRWRKGPHFAAGHQWVQDLLASLEARAPPNDTLGPV